MSRELTVDPEESQTSRNEVRALSALAFDDLGRLPGAIRDVHLGIAERAFRGAGPSAQPVKVIHDALSSTAYGGIGAGAAMLGRAADEVMGQLGIGEDVDLASGRRGSGVIAALNGLMGDRLERERSALHQPAAVRVQGEPIALRTDALHRAFPDAAPRIVVFLHGLMETEFSWSRGEQSAGETYGSRLEGEFPCTAVFVRYNSGLHISQNGRAIAALLEQLVASWPVEVHEVCLVGHSMGGLVARSACHYAQESGQTWVQSVTRVVSLGTPHTGAPLEQGVHLASAVLDRLPETRPLSAFLRRRSAGIRDLRHGSLVDEDWRGRDPDALRAVAVREVPLLPWATHCFVSATLTRDAQHPLGQVLGDILVLPGSAAGRSRSRRIPFREEHGRHVGGLHHFALLNDPQVYEHLRGWLAPSREPAAA